MTFPVLQTGSDATPSRSVPQAPKLLDRLRMALETRRYRPETVGRFVEWNRQYILVHDKRHPETMWREQIEAFLGHLAQLGYGVELQAQARQAVAFLYREVLGRALAWPEIARARGGGEPAGAEPPKLLDRARAVLRARHYAWRTEECYVTWMRRYLLFPNQRHPLEMATAPVGRSSRQEQLQYAERRKNSCHAVSRTSRCTNWLINSRCGFFKNPSASRRKSATR